MNRSTPRHRIAVSTVFAGNGILFGSLFARLPEVKERLGLDEAELGLALLGAPVGLIAAVAIAGAQVVRRGSRIVSAVGAVIYGGLLVLPAIAPNLVTLIAGMVILGAGSGILDVAMNAQGVTVEKTYPRRIFASLHAAFSFGALAGAGTAGLAAEAGLALAPHLLIVSAVVLAASLTGIRAFMPDAQVAVPGEERPPAFARPTRPLAALGAVAFASLLAEGAVSDWSAVYLDEVQGAAAGTAAAGLATFSLAMGFGRLAGDRIADRIGSRALARGGLLVAAAGIAAVAASPSAATAILALVGLGLGLAAVYPLALRAAAVRRDVPSAASIAAVTTTGYTGFLAGPPLVGLIAHATSLRVSFVVVAAMLLGAAALAGAVRDGGLTAGAEEASVQAPRTPAPA